MSPDRRTFLSAAAAASLGAAPAWGATGALPDAVRPRRLRAGETVGLVSPASAIAKPVEVDEAVAFVESLGLHARVGAHVRGRFGSLAGTDEERAADVNAMFADDAVRMVLAMRGGWGCARMLAHLDLDLVAAHPKIVLGYSDLSSLLVGLHRRTGLVTFHGPNATSSWNDFNRRHLRRVLFDAEAATLENVEKLRTTTITPGVARGRLIGGNLSVLAAIVGSPWLPSLDGAVLFLEDVGEEPYRVDRMLTTLRLAGHLDRLAAFVFGSCRRCDVPEGSTQFPVSALLRQHVGPLDVPAFEGAMIGHVAEQFTLPVGLDVEVDADRGTMTLLRPAVT